MVMDKRLKRETEVTSRTRFSDLDSLLFVEDTALWLRVTDLAKLTSANRQLSRTPWPQAAEFLFRATGVSLSKKNLEASLVGLAQRLHGPAIVDALARTDSQSRGTLAWAEENAHRAAVGIAAVLSSNDWSHVKRPNYLANTLAAGLVKQIQRGQLGFNSALSALGSMMMHGRMEMSVVQSALREAGVAQLMASLLRHPKPEVQQQALTTITMACHKGDPLDFASTDVLAGVMAAAESGCYLTKMCSLEALHWVIPLNPEKFSDAGVAVVLDSLAEGQAHGDTDMMRVFAVGVLHQLALEGEEHVLRAAKQGCVPLLMAVLKQQLADPDEILLDEVLWCIQSFTELAAPRDEAIKQGLLPALFTALQTEGCPADIESILSILQLCVLDLPWALMHTRGKETVLQRIVAIARHGEWANQARQARRLLQCLAQDVPLGRLIRQFGFHVQFFGFQVHGEEGQDGEDI